MQNKPKPGRPKQAETKKHINLRLSTDIINFIKSQPNQQIYIENLVRNDFNTLKNKI